MLADLEKLNLKGSGLHGGKLGLCLAYSVAGLKSGNRIFKQKASELFYQIAEEITDLNDWTFSSGIIGFGWMTEYLAGNGIIEMDTHSFLMDLDDQVYLNVLMKKNPNLGLESGDVGMALYLYKRLSNQQTHDVFFRMICNVECLSILIERICEKTESVIFKTGINLDNLVVLSQILFLFSKIEPTKIGNQTVIRTISAILKMAEDAILEKGLRQSESLNHLTAWKSILNVTPACKLEMYREAEKELQDRIENTQQDPRGIYTYLMYLDSKNEYGWMEAWLK